MLMQGQPPRLSLLAVKKTFVIPNRAEGPVRNLLFAASA
jgi:hypothetical protein